METECMACGEKVPVPEGRSGDKVIVVCPHCAFRFQVFIPSDVGAATLFQPQLLSEELADDQGSGEAVEEATGASTLRVGSGTTLLDSKGRPASAPPLETVAQAVLILAGAVPGEERLPLTGAKTVVGRQEADIAIDDPALSSRHFEIEAKGQEFFIRDLDSRNGTFLNGNRVRAAQLASGDRIRAGQSTLTFRIVEVVRWDGPDADAPDSSD